MFASSTTPPRPRLRHAPRYDPRAVVSQPSSPALPPSPTRRVRHARSQQRFYKCDDVSAVLSNENVALPSAALERPLLKEAEVPCCAFTKAGGRCLAANCRADARKASHSNKAALILLSNIAGFGRARLVNGMAI